MTLNVMKPAEGIYTTSEMPKVFTLPVKCRRYLHRMKSTGVFTLKGEMTRVFTLKGEMPKVFTLHSVRVFTPKENKWGIYTTL